MSNKEKDVIKLFKNPTTENCTNMIKKYKEYTLPDKNDFDNERDYAIEVEETICDIFELEMVEYNLFFPPYKKT